MLHEFLLSNRDEILKMTEEKSLQLAGARPSSEQLQRGLPFFFEQLLDVLRLGEHKKGRTVVDRSKMVKAADDSDEAALASASEHPEDIELAKVAGRHGTELHRLGYTLSHVVHAYGAMCQSITELASTKNISVKAYEFRDLNRCLDVAIAGAVTEFQSRRNTQDVSRQVEHLGFLAHELRNALASVKISLELIKNGTVGFSGSTGRVMERGIRRMESLIDRSLTEVRLSVDPEVHVESVNLLTLVEQIVITAEVEAQIRNQVLQVHIDPTLNFEADQQLIYSAVSNLIQNALKYTPEGGVIQVRGTEHGEHVVIEVEDQCGGLPFAAAELFMPFIQRSKNRKGLGLGLTIAQRAINLMHGTIDARDLPGRGCIFKVVMIRKAQP